MSEYIHRDDASGLTYYEAGAGTDLLFFHGFGSSPEGYTPLLEELAHQYHVIAPFLYSRGVKGIADVVGRIESLLSRIGTGGPYLVACYSNGSFPATLFTSRNTPNVSRLILLASMVKPGSLFFIDRGILLLLTLCKHLTISHERNHVQRLLRVFTGNILTNLPGMLTQLKDAYAMDIIQTLRNAGIPVQIISGTKDIVVPPSQGHMLHEALSSSTLTLLAGDHLMGILTPDVIVREIRGRENGEGKV